MPDQSIFRRMGGYLFGLSPPSAKVSPFQEVGVGGTVIYGGNILSHEKDYRVSGARRWETYSELATNISIVAASVRYFLNVVSGSDWKLKPASDKGDAKAAAEFIEEVIHDMFTPWRRVVRRTSMYRFQGFGVQEWTAKRRSKDNKIGLDDIEARPQHTIQFWNTDDRGTVTGVWQRDPRSGTLLYLPRSKILYMVEDSMTDSPEGLGLFRHMVEPYERLKLYIQLEGHGFERDLRGIPIGRVPYAALREAVKAGVLTEDDQAKIVQGIEKFVSMQQKQADTSIVLDSAPYVTENDSGRQFSGVMQYGIELLQGQQPGFAELDKAITRLNREIARIIGTEHLLLGEQGSGANRALSEDKSRNLYLTINGTMDEICDAANKDVVATVCDLNGIDEDLRPKLAHSDVSFRTVTEITAGLRDMAQAGAILAPNDPVINDVRDMLGLEHAPEQPTGVLPVGAGAAPSRGRPVPGAGGQVAAPQSVPQPPPQPAKQT